ncbi:MAG: HD domain-containing protein [Ardenticatenaceae bacterium]
MMQLKPIIDTILAQYSLSPFGIHGVSHWARVLENGLRLAEQTGANIKVVKLFALFHDAQRINEGHDDQHGLRGAEYAASLRGKLFTLSDEEFEHLYTACVYHTDGLTTGDITVQTCWDADRLDLGRVWIQPNPKYLCTGAAKDPKMIEWATQRSQTYFVPKFVQTQWHVPDGEAR